MSKDATRQVSTLVVEIGHKAGDELPEGATVAALMTDPGTRAKVGINELLRD